MNKPAKRAVAFSLSAMLAINTVIVSIPVSAEETKGTTYTHDGYRVEYTVRNEWSGNQNIEITVTNTGSEILSDWAMGYNAYGEINGLWNAQVYGHQGTEYILKAADYNSEILPGQTINFGYTLSGDEFKIPQDIRNCAQRVDIADGFDVYYNIVGDYGSTYQAEIFIKNTSDADISAWNLSFDANAAIDNIWNGKIISKGESCYKVKNAENNHVIAAGKEVSFSFTGSRLDNEDDKNYDISFGNYKLTAMFIPMEFGFEIDPSLDTDNDGLPDYYENELGTDKNDPDTDGDMLPDGYEVFTLGTDPLKKDTDDNGISDADEDFDEDGLNNIREFTETTDPLSEDTDFDGLKDGDELNINHTNPIKSDTDGDKIVDGDEVALGLDPNNGSTYGYPDNEYTVEQNVSSDNNAFNRINGRDDNPYTISVDINAAGVAENNIHARESGYSYQILQNDAVLGLVPEISYTDGLSVKDVTINFNIKDISAAIEDLMVFKYFEDNNILLPIETTYDENNNIISTHVNEVGTYCLIDVIKWVDNLKDSSSTGFEIGGDNEPANIVFCIDTRNIVDEESFEQVKADIKAVTEDSFEKYSDIKIYVYYQKFGSDFKANHYLLKDSEGNSYFTSLEETEKALDTVERYMIKSSKWAYDFVSASQFMINKCDNNIIAMYHITADDRVMGGIDAAKKLKQSVLTDMYTTSDDEEVQRIHISTLCPSSEKSFDTSSYAYEMAQISGGIALSGTDIDDSNAIVEESEFTILTSIASKGSRSGKKPVEKNLVEILGDGGNQYQIISSTSLTTINLKGPLVKDSGTKSDEDELTDWEEVNIDAIKELKNDSIVEDKIRSKDLPSVFDVMGYYGRCKSGYVYEGLKEFLMDNRSDLSNAIHNTYILPIYSDPTKKDSDGDGIKDDYDVRKLVLDEYPSYFVKYINDEIILHKQVLQDPVNKFTIVMEPLGDILVKKEITELEAYENDNLGILFDDWYIYSVKDDNDNWNYSLIKLRTNQDEMRFGVAIPFKEFNMSLLIGSSNPGIKKALSKELVDITQMENVKHDESIRSFWANENNSSCYFVSSIYINLVIINEMHDGRIPAKTYLKRHNKIINEYPEVYDNETQEIIISNPMNISLGVIHSILVTHSGNPNMHSFAAEIIAHAIYAKNNVPIVYSHAVKADLGANEEKDDFTDNDYINDNGKYVKHQKGIHVDEIVFPSFTEVLNAVEE